MTDPLANRAVASAAHPSRTSQPALDHRRQRLDNRSFHSPEPRMTAAKTSGPASMQVPDQAGRFGAFGGRYVPETLTRALDELTAEYDKACRDPEFQAELDELLQHYVGRPSPLYFAKRLSEQVRRGADLAQARRPEPHRRPQDQQHARPGAAHAADGQEAGDRRDRRRASTAWPPPPPVPTSASTASSTWARRTFAGRRRTSSA